MRGAKSKNNPIDDGTSGPCPVGHYCPPGTSHPKGCPAGTYMPVTGESACFSCMKGYYCPENSTDYTPYACPEGHYCPNGTRFAKQYPCPSGTFRNQTMGQGLEDCFKCLKGEYCAGTGLTKTSGKCAPGFFCVRGSKSRTPLEYDNFTSGDCLCPSNMTGAFFSFLFNI